MTVTWENHTEMVKNGEEEQKQEKSEKSLTLQVASSNHNGLHLISTMWPLCSCEANLALSPLTSPGRQSQDKGGINARSGVGKH